MSTAIVAIAKKRSCACIEKGNSCVRIAVDRFASLTSFVHHADKSTSNNAGMDLANLAEERAKLDSLCCDSGDESIEYGSETLPVPVGMDLEDVTNTADESQRTTLSKNSANFDEEEEAENTENDVMVDDDMKKQDKNRTAYEAFENGTVGKSPVCKRSRET